MNDWDSIDQDLLEQELKTKQRRDERREAFWHRLEENKAMPDREVLEHLSGLVDDEIERARALWGKLAPEVRRELVFTLGEIAEANFSMDFSAVFRIAITDPDADIRAAAIKGLDEDEDVRLVPAYVDLLKHDPVAGVRAAAAGALAKFVLLGELEKIRPGPFHAAVRALRDSYTDPGETLDVQRRAMESLAYTGEHNVPAIINSAYAHDDEAMRRGAVLAMGRSADKRWGKIVRHELRSPSPGMRLEATRACGELQLREAVQDIIEMVEDVDTRIRAMALWSLGQIGGNLARKTLQRYARTEDGALSEVAHEALQELEFLYGNISSFFGPPEEYDGETEELWQMPRLSDLREDEDGEDTDSDDEMSDEDEIIEELFGDLLDTDEDDDDLGLFEPSDEDDEEAWS